MLAGKAEVDRDAAAVETRVYSIGRCCQSTCSVSNETLITYSNNDNQHKDQKTRIRRPAILRHKERVYLDRDEVPGCLVVLVAVVEIH